MILVVLILKNIELIILKGTGAKLIKCLGEWEYSNFPLLTFIITIFQLVRKI